MRSRIAMSAAFIACLLMTIGAGTALASQQGSITSLTELAERWSAAYPDRDVYQCAEATGTGQHPDADFEAPHALGAVILYGISGDFQVYEDVKTGDRITAPGGEGIRFVVKVRWVGIGGYYSVCPESQPTTTSSTSTVVESTTTTQAETTTSVAVESSTTQPQESTSTAVAPTTSTPASTSTSALPATTVQEETTTTQPPEESSTTTRPETSTSVITEQTTTTIAVEELPATGFDFLGLAAMGLIVLGGGVMVLMRVSADDGKD